MGSCAVLTSTHRVLQWTKQQLAKLSTHAESSSARRWEIVREGHSEGESALETGAPSLQGFQTDYQRLWQDQGKRHLYWIDAKCV